MITPQQARKEMFLLVYSTWMNKSAAIAGYVPEIRWQGIEKPALPGADKFWMRVGTTTVTTRQSGHMSPDGPGRSPVVYTNYGFITLQMFAPMKGSNSWSKGELLSELGQAMFMASETPGSIWFRNPRIRELNNDGTWYRWNVIADYQFDQSKGISEAKKFLSVDGLGDGLAFVGDRLVIDIDDLPFFTDPNDGLGLEGSDLKVDIDNLPDG